jgi:hypothetical protein
MHTLLITVLISLAVLLGLAVLLLDRERSL